MANAVLLILDHRIETDIFHAFEDIGFHKGIGLFQLGDKLLRLQALGGSGPVLMTGAAGLGKMTGTLQEMQFVVIPPGTDIALPDQIQGPDQLHAFKIRTVKFGHHGLDLTAVDHPHENGLDHIIIMVPQSDLVAAQ